MKSRWIFTFIAIALCVVAAGWGAGVTAEADRQAEAHKAEAAGFVVAREAREGEIELLVVGLQGEIGRLEEVIGEKPKIVTVTKWKARPIRVPRTELTPDDPCPIPICDIPVMSFGGQLDPNPLTHDDFVFSIRGTVANAESIAGNIFVLGTADLWLLEPGPPKKLGSAPWDARATTTLVPDFRPRSPRWMFGPSVGLISAPGGPDQYGGTTDLVYGLNVLAPPWRLRRLALRPTGTVLAGSGNTLALVSLTGGIRK